MPNWVYNDLEITGPEVELERFMAECFTMEAEGPHFDFDKLIPMPAEIRESTDVGGSDLDGDVRFPDWYKWRCCNWGTKWNASDTEVALTVNGSKVITLRFDTAWSIPWPIYEELAERFPLLTIEGEIFEPMMEFGGHIRCHGGKIDYEDKSEQIQAEMAEYHARTNREQEQKFYQALLHYVADQPSDITPGTIGEKKAQIAKRIVREDPSLVSPERRTEFMEKIEAIYDRDHAVSVTLSDDDIPF